MTVIASESAPSPLTITLLGPMQVRVHNRPLPPMRSRKALWLLALLALRHGRPVEREWLAGTLWPDSDQNRASTNLNVVLSELRRALEDQSKRLQSPARHTLALDLAGAEVDVFTFDAALVSKKREALKQAVALYRGPLLEGCAEEWIEQERSAREQNCLQALQTLADTALAGGDYATAVGYFQRAVGINLWSDTARRGLMEALAKNGDRNAALHVYREFVELLRSDPSATPDEETNALYVRLRAEARQHASAQGAGIAGETADNEAIAPVISGALPLSLTDLIGREEERIAVAAKLRSSRLVTLTGPGGIGKTRLAIEIARERAHDVAYADGVWFVSLETLAEGTLVVSQITDVLGLREETGRSLLESLTDYLRPKRLLLLLDNCEHLLEASAQVAAYLLRECTHVRILATSREALGIIGEAVWQTPPLAAPDTTHLPSGKTTLLRVLMSYESVQLFVERAAACQKNFALTGSNAQAVAQICLQLEGIPLAIELAAARVRAMSVEHLAARLNDRLGLLTVGDRAAQARQQTLRATLDWSYALLSEAERALLGRLSVFAGGWTLEAAEAIAKDESESHSSVSSQQSSPVIALLTSLVEKSLVAFEERQGNGRFRLLDMVRQYAAERLGSEMPLAQSRHLEWALALAEKAAPLLDGAEREQWMQRLEAERGNLRAALDWCEAGAEAEAHLKLASALWRFWYIRGDFFEGRSALKRALECAEGRATTTEAREKTLNAAGAAAYYQNDYDAAHTLFAEALRLCQARDNRRGIAEALNNLGNVAHNRSDYDQARAFYEESLSLYRALDDRMGTAKTLVNLGNVARYTDPAQQRPLYEQSLSLLRELGNRTVIGDTLRNLATLTYRQGDFLSARALAEESLALAQEVGNKSSTAYALHLLGNVCVVLKDTPAAQSFYEGSLNLSRETGNRSMEAWALLGLGYTANAQNSPASAHALYEQGRQLFAAIGERLSEAEALNCLGKLAQERGDWTDAQSLYRKSATIFRMVGDASGLEASMRELGAALFRSGKGEAAARLWGAAWSLRESVGKPLVPQDEKDQHELQVEQVRTTLGQEDFANLWEEGCARPWDQAVS